MSRLTVLEMMQRVFWRAGKGAVLAVALTVALLATSARMGAQASAGIVGTVTDESGSVVPNANMQIV